MGDGPALRLPLSTAERHKEGSRTFKCPATFFVRLRRENSLDTFSLVRAVRAAAAFARRTALLAFVQTRAILSPSVGAVSSHPLSGCEVGARLPRQLNRPYNIRTPSFVYSTR